METSKMIFHKMEILTHYLKIVLKCSAWLFLHGSALCQTQICTLSTNYYFHTRVITETVLTFNLKYLAHESQFPTL